MNECQWPSQLKTTIIFFEIVFASKPQGNKPLSKWNNHHNLKSKIGNTFPFLQFFCRSVITKSGKQRFHGITILGFFLVIKRENIFNLKPLNFILFTFFFFFNWDSRHARLNSHYEAWSYNKKKAQKRLPDTENLFAKNLQLKDVC